MDDDIRRSKRRRRLLPPPPYPENATDIIPEHVATQLFHRSIAQILKDAGYSSATPTAQERLRQLSENHLRRMCQTVCLFTTSQRRTRPTVLEFEDMLSTLSIPISALDTEARRHPTPGVLQLPPPSPPPPPADPPGLRELLGPELVDSNRKKPYPHLPDWPSRHTWCATPVYAERPTEPRVIREKATVEARLAEKALRGLLKVGRKGPAVGGGEWEKCMRELGGGGDEGPLDVVVNSEAKFWRRGGKRKSGA